MSGRGRVRVCACNCVSDFADDIAKGQIRSTHDMSTKIAPVSSLRSWSRISIWSITFLLVISPCTLSQRSEYTYNSRLGGLNSKLNDIFNRQQKRDPGFSLVLGVSRHLYNFPSIHMHNLFLENIITCNISTAIDSTLHIESHEGCYSRFNSFKKKF